jgi:hypothetical protein
MSTDVAIAVVRRVLSNGWQPLVGTWRRRELRTPCITDKGSVTIPLHGWCGLELHRHLSNVAKPCAYPVPLASPALASPRFGQDVRSPLFGALPRAAALHPSSKQ